MADAGVSTPGTLRKVPNQPKTPLRSFRIPDAEWEAAQRAAAAQGETVSDVIRRALAAYTKRVEKTQRQP